jgi:hypothetical protein
MRGQTTRTNRQVVWGVFDVSVTFEPTRILVVVCPPGRQRTTSRRDETPTPLTPLGEHRPRRHVITV